MNVVFWICGPFMVLGGLGLILFRKAVYSALSMAFAMINLAALYASLDAPFLFAIQIIVYAGAIMVLFLFVVMLLNAPHEETNFDERTHPMLRPGPMRFGAVLALALIAELVWALARSAPPSTFSTTPVTSVAAIGRSLFTDYAFQFEVTSVLILVAMVGAVVMARREDHPGAKR